MDDTSEFTLSNPPALFNRTVVMHFISRVKSSPVTSLEFELLAIRAASSFNERACESQSFKRSCYWGHSGAIVLSEGSKQTANVDASTFNERRSES